MTMPSELTGLMASAHRDEMLRAAQAWNRARRPRRRRWLSRPEEVDAAAVVAMPEKPDPADAPTDVRPAA